MTGRSHQIILCVTLRMLLFADYIITHTRIYIQTWNSVTVAQLLDSKASSVLPVVVFIANTLVDTILNTLVMDQSYTYYMHYIVYFVMLCSELRNKLELRVDFFLHKNMKNYVIFDYWYYVLAHSCHRLERQQHSLRTVNTAFIKNDMGACLYITLKRTTRNVSFECTEVTLALVILIRGKRMTLQGLLIFQLQIYIIFLVLCAS